MTWLQGLHVRSWWLANMSIIGLLVAIAVAGLLALGINERVRGVLVLALQYDLEIEDRADDLRVAILDMRHYHRNLVFGGPSPRRLTDFETAYEQLLSHIDRLSQLGIDSENLPDEAELRENAEHYYIEFQPAIALYYDDPQAFDLASDDGLWLLAELESDALRFERFGEREAADALFGVEGAANSARSLLIAKLAGHILIGAVLAYLIIRNLREQRRAAAELAHALQLKTDFIADMSHELRTPLTVVRANAEVALGLDRTCVHTELLEEISKEAEHMTHLVEDLLFLARSDAGAVPLAQELVNIRSFLTELAERSSVLARGRGVTVQLELAGEGLVRIDRERIAQAVLILVDNAVKYSPVDKTITLRSALHGAEVVIEVEDEGPGIPEQDLPLVFERFYRVDKARTRKQGGVGLGLAIAKSIVTAHGGRIEAESVLNKGTKMRYYLPLVTTLQPMRSLTDHLVIEEAV
jgi:two-component system, OmpR family, sensor histidine kinase VicK